MMNYVIKTKVYFLINCFFIAVCINLPFSLFATTFADIPESVSCRAGLVDEWFTQDINVLSNATSEFVKNEMNEEFLVHSEIDESETKIIISPCVKMKAKIMDATSNQMVMYDTWPPEAAGTWVLYRNTQTGKPVRIQMYFQNNPEVYFQITPFEERSCAELVVFGTSAVQNVILGVPFESFYTLSLKDFYSISEKLLPWRYVLIPQGMYNGNIQMVGAIRDLLPSFLQVKDAAYNEVGEPVWISTGLRREDVDKKTISVSSMGFLKWITDGLVEPLTGSGCYITPLSTPTLNPISGSLASVTLENTDLYKSLNWTRNLAVAVSAARSRDSSVRFANSGAGVTKLEMPGCPHITNVGYPIEQLPGLLSVLAVTEPDLFFFGAICEKVPIEKELHQYVNGAAIFPYYSSDGKFHVVVFESGVEYTLTQFIKKYSNTFIELVRVKASIEFSPFGNVTE
jgi:hypothetical protein